MHPFIAFASEEYSLTDWLKYYPEVPFPAEEIKKATHTAWEELAACRKDMQKKGEETIRF